MQEPDAAAQVTSDPIARKVDQLKDLHPSDIAEQIDDLSLEEMRAVLRALSDETVAKVIAQLPPEPQAKLLENMRLERLTDILPEMYTDDAVDALANVSPERLQDIMDKLPDSEVKELVSLLAYPEDTAGGIMQTEVYTVSVEHTLGEAREAIRKDEDQHGDGVMYIYAVDENFRLQGVLRLRDLLFRDLRRKVKDVMITEVRAVSVHADQEEIANVFQKYGFGGLPVVDDFGKLVGLVTADDVMDVIQEEATEDMQRMVGLSGEETVTTTWSRSVGNRLPWLCINLGTAFLAGWVVSRFEGTINRYGMLAAFLPIIGGMGGNAGSQTLTIVVRSLALGEIENNEWRRLLGKELIVGCITGFTIGLLVGLVSWFWRGSYVVGGVVFLAMMLNMIAAAAAGVLVPIGLRSAKVDPALASSIMVTTVTDIVGFFLFLSFASVALSLLPI